MKKFVSLVLAIAMVLTLTVAAAAATIVPSVELAGYPEPVIVDGGDGVFYFGEYIVDGDTMPIPVGDLVLSDLAGNRSIPQADLDNIPGANEILAAADAKLKASYQEIKGAATLRDVISALPAAANTTYTVTDLFDLSPVGEAVATAEAMFQEGNQLRVSLKQNINNASTFYLATKCGETWKVLDSSKYTISGGIITITFDELCPIAFIQSATTGTGGNVVTSPDTSANRIGGVAAALCLTGALGCFVMGARKKNED